MSANEAAVRVPHTEATELGFLAAGGEMSELMRTHDWASSLLGSVAQWPQSLRTAVGIMLSSRYPMFIWWGGQLVNLYNDAYRPFLGTKHPLSLGQSARQVWAEIWEQIGPRTEAVLHRGESTFDEALLLIMERFGYPEETYFTFSYSPIRADDGTVGGIFCAVTDETQRVIGERRLRLLREVAAASSEAPTPEQVCRTALGISSSARDLPFALLYLNAGDGRTAHLAAWSNIPSDSAAAPLTIDMQVDQSPWPLRRALLENDAVVVDGLMAQRGAPSTGPWERPSDRAVIVPLRDHSQASVAGFLVAGLNPYLPFEAEYRGFVGLLAHQIAAGIGRAHAYQEEHRRAEVLAELDRAKTVFFSNISHEFRTPLTLILGPLTEAASHPAVTPPVRAHLERAQHNALRLLKLVNTLLEFSRIEAGRMTASFEPTDLAAFTRELASNFNSAMEQAGLAFRVECNDLGAPVYVDRAMWEKIVLNLLSNAFKFTFHGGITVRLQGLAEQVLLEVADTGVGVPEYELPRLFERFHRVEGTVGRTQEGSGIGLALVAELVKLHGGRIEVTSELGTGTTFRVALPRGSAHLPAEHLKAANAPASSAVEARVFVQEALRWIPAHSVQDSPKMLPPVEHEPQRLDQRFARTAGARILLADDNADMRVYLHDLLAPRYVVEAVADGAQALEAARRERPSLILSDIMMPRLDGLGLLHALRSDEKLRDIPVVLISARAGEEARVEGLDRGADDYVIKPFSARELLARVGALLELAQMRQENEERLRSLFKSAAHLAAIVESSEDAIVSKTLEGVIQSWNAGAERIFGWSAAEAIGRSITLIIPPELLAEEQYILDTLKRGGRIDHFETTRIAKDGRRIDVSLTVSPVRDQTGRVIGASKIARDISVRKRIEQLLREREQALIEADQRKDEFLAVLAHELRNPLAPLANAGEILSRTLAHDAPARGAVGMIKRQVTQLTRLVDDLLDVSRITQGRIQLKQEPLDLAAVITQAVENVEPQLLAKRHKLTTTCTYGPPFFVNGDFARLVQCVSNVLTNAVKYTDPGGQISIRTHGDQLNAFIEITDTGSGIAPDLLPRIFDLFVQSQHTLDHSEGGLGIGLALVKRLLQMHHGDVCARSEGVGRGSTFEIRLPRIANAAVIKSEVPSLERHSPRRVLIVDDNVDAATSLALLLNFRNHETCVAHNGVDALDCVQSFRPQVAIIDIGLPGMDGYEVAQRLRANPMLHGLRLIALTGYGQTEDRERVHRAGFDDHLVKPVDLASLELSLEGISAADRPPAAELPCSVDRITTAPLP